MANKKLKKRSLSESDQTVKTVTSTNDSITTKKKKQKAENTIENEQPALKKIKSENDAKGKAESDVKIKTEPGKKNKAKFGSKIKAEPGTKIKTESNIKIKTEPNLKIKKEQNAEENTTVTQNSNKNEKKKQKKHAFHVKGDGKADSEALKATESVNLKNQEKLDKPVSKTQSKLLKYSPEQLKQRIQEIESRGASSKTAKRKLAIFKKKLSIMEGTENMTENKLVPKVSNPKKNKKEASSKNSTESNATIQNIQNINENSKVKNKIKGNKKVQDVQKAEKTKTSLKLQAAEKKAKKGKNKTQGGNFVKTEIKDESDEDDDDDNDDSDDNEEDNSSDDMTVNNVKREKVEKEEEEEDDDDDDDDDDEDSDDDAKPKKKAPAKIVKKKRYVLFVGNLPYDVTAKDVRSHFSTKVSAITDVRLPLDSESSKSRGFAYVELPDQENYEKALALNHSFINGRRINVTYTGDGKNNKAKTVAKSKKLAALRKAGKLAGSKKFSYKGKQKKPQPNA